MTAMWATESDLAHALEVLQQRYPGEKIEIVDTFDIAWSGWELDSQGALITRDGRAAAVTTRYPARRG